jgi:hypothetical protein
MKNASFSYSNRRYTRIVFERNHPRSMSIFLILVLLLRINNCPFFSTISYQLFHVLPSLFTHCNAHRTREYSVLPLMMIFLVGCCCFVVRNNLKNKICESKRRERNIPWLLSCLSSCSFFILARSSISCSNYNTWQAYHH